MGHLIINCKDEADWHKERSKGIGGSDAAAIIGKNPYMTNVDLWMIKTGRKKQQDISKKDCVIYGKKAEHYLRELFKLDYPEYEVAHGQYDIHVHNEYDFIRASLDGELLLKSTQQKGILEIKTTEIKRKEDWQKWNNQIPINYYCQVLHYFSIDPEYLFANLEAQIKYNKTKTTKHYHLERENHKEDIEYLTEKEIAFQWYIKEDKQPPLILPEI